MLATPLFNKRVSAIERMDRNISPALERVGAKQKKTLLDSRAQASLQLAYRGAHNIRFYDGGKWGVGIYEIYDQEAKFEMFITVYIHLLEHQSPHLYFDNKKNNRIFHEDFPEKMGRAELVQYDGYISGRYNLYAPQGYAIDSLVVGAPDVLDAVDRLNMGADVEVVGNQLYLIFPQAVPLDTELEALVANGNQLAKEFDDNLSRYKDERAISFGQPIGYSGRRLVRK